MNKITKNTALLCPNSKIKKSIFIIEYRIWKRINQIFEILEIFAFTALAIDKTFFQRNFLPTKIEVMSMYVQTKSSNKWCRKFVKILEQQI